MDEWISIFRTGRHTDSAGNERDWSEKDLDTIVAKYNPAEHEAPVVIGHPKDTAPAWGWVEALKRQGGILYAKLKDLVPEFVEMVRQGLFKKRSISLYPDLSLQHVGFLGATPPAVKGLPDVNFKQGGGYLMYSEVEITTDAGEQLSRLAKEKLDKARERGMEMTFSEAFSAVQVENRELALQYAKSITPRSKEVILVP